LIEGWHVLVPNKSTGTSISAQGVRSRLERRRLAPRQISPKRCSGAHVSTHIPSVHPFSPPTPAIFAICRRQTLPRPWMPPTIIHRLVPLSRCRSSRHRFSSSAAHNQ
jgi:hypothetical protein